MHGHHVQIQKVIYSQAQWRRNDFKIVEARVWKNYVVPLHCFGSKSAISRFGERFCDGPYSLISFLFAVLLTVPPAVPSHL